MAVRESVVASGVPVHHRPWPTADGNGHGAAAPGRPAARLAYNPALDGIRGLAVLAVVLFHSGVSWARGGFLGVSTFFTLSGYLITSLLLAERAATGRIDLRRFWSRRIRRLFPASALTLLVVAGAALVVDAHWERSLRGDVLAALGQVANWRMLLDDRSYAELFTSPSPLVHFWSLAIEEQFYWLFPLVTAGVLGVARGSLRAYGAALGGLVGISAVTTLALGPARGDAVYYSTVTRMGEILIGSLLAVAVSRRAIRGPWATRLAAVGGVLALAVSAWAVTTIDQTRTVLDQGGLLVFALVSATLVWAATVPGPVRRVLAVEPLRRLGVISYGIYLFHWPVFLLLDQQRTGLDGPALLALRCAVTLLAAVVSYTLLERPVRTGERPRVLPVPAVAVGSVVLVAGVAVVVPAVSDPPADMFEAWASAVEEATDPAALSPDTRIGYAVGDSTMLVTGMGLTEWGRQRGGLFIADMSGGLGCSLSRQGERLKDGRPVVPPDHCTDWARDIPHDVAALRERYGRADFAIIQTGPWDVADRRLPGDDQGRAPGDPVFDAHLESELASLTDMLLEQDLVVVWLTSPRLDIGRGQSVGAGPPPPEADPRRVDRLNEIIGSIATGRPRVAVVDLAGHIDSLPPAEDARLRPDGVHFGHDTTVEVAEWLGPAVVDAVDGAPPA